MSPSSSRHLAYSVAMMDEFHVKFYLKLTQFFTKKEFFKCVWAILIHKQIIFLIIIIITNNNFLYNIYKILTIYYLDYYYNSNEIFLKNNFYEKKYIFELTKRKSK